MELLYMTKLISLLESNEQVVGTLIRLQNDGFKYIVVVTPEQAEAYQTHFERDGIVMLVDVTTTDEHLTTYISDVLDDLKEVAGAYIMINDVKEPALQLTLDIPEAVSAVAEDCGCDNPFDALERVDPLLAELKCDVCNVGNVKGVFASSCGPISFAYCQTCLDLGAEPYGAVVGYLACAVSDGEDVRPERGIINERYQKLIDVSLATAKKTREELYADITSSVKEYEKMLADEEMEHQRYLAENKPAEVEGEFLAVFDAPTLGEPVNEVVNGFTICFVDNQYEVYHPVYDGAFKLFESEDRQEAIDWAHKENVSEWEARLL